MKNKLLLTFVTFITLISYFISPRIVSAACDVTAVHFDTQSNTFTCSRYQLCPYNNKCCEDPATECPSPIGNCSGIQTAIGCLPWDSKAFGNAILPWGLGLAGGIAFITLLYASLQIVTASGDPKKLKAAQELLVAAISGLVLIILAVILLNFLGVKILNLGGQGFSV